MIDPRHASSEAHLLARQKTIDALIVDCSWITVRRQNKKSPQALIPFS